MPEVAMDDGARLWYEEHGEGPTVVFLHGALAAGAAFRGQRAALHDLGRLVLVDQRGHGRATHLGAEVPWETLTLPRLVADAEALIDHLSPAAPVSLVGASMGGLVAAHLAARRPGRVARLALLGTPGLPSPERQRFFATTDPDHLVSLTAALVARWHGEPYWRELARRLFAGFARGEEFPGIVPAPRALVMQGEEDELLERDEAAAWAARIDGEVEVVRAPGKHAFFADGREGSRAANAALRRLLRPA